MDVWLPDFVTDLKGQLVFAIVDIRRFQEVAACCMLEDFASNVINDPCSDFSPNAIRRDIKSTLPKKIRPTSFSLQGLQAEALLLKGARNCLILVTV